MTIKLDDLMKIKKIIIAVGLIISFCSVMARPTSIAHLARVTASSMENGKFEATNITDGIIAVHGHGCWKTNDKNAWIQLNWDKNQLINKIVIYNYPEVENRVKSGRLEFSDGSSIDVQLPNDGTAKAFEFEEKDIDGFRFVIDGRVNNTKGLSEIEVFSSPNQYKEPVEWVDPYIETNKGRFFFFITGSRPYGMISAAPMTKNSNTGGGEGDADGGGYAYNDKEILGFPQIHSWTLSGINMMPTLANIDPTKGENEWKSSFKHDDEIVQPGYHRVFLPESNTWVEQTSTDRVSFYRFCWTKDTEAQILFSLGQLLGNSRMTDAKIKKNSYTEFEGSISSVDRAYGVGPKDIKIFFVVRLDKPWKSLGGWNGRKRYQDITTLEEDTAGTSILYDVKAGEKLLMKIAISYTSIENARNNMVKECDHWNFDQVKDESRNTWNEWLGRIQVEGGTIAQKIKFYTDLWHVLLGRQRINDISGDYPDRTEAIEHHGFLTDAVFKVKNVGVDDSGSLLHNMYNSDAFWLTQWNLNVLWGLAWPEVQDNMASSMVAYSNNGGLLPRGPAGGGYTYIMTGCPSTNLIVSAFMKDILTKTNPGNAFDQIKNNHMPGGMMGPNHINPDGLRFYIEQGWWPDNAGFTIEMAFQDWAAAQMAKKLGKFFDYHYFMSRSTSWKNCFNPEINLLLPKNADGNFIHKNPFDANGFVEANSWQTTWGVSHDIKGLSMLMGGDSILTDKLNFAFENAASSNFIGSYWGNAYVSYANQPGCSNAHVFSYAGKPWLTQYWVRKVNEQTYGGITPDLGYGGHDEDQGQHGGVSALMSIGLFNILGTESIIPYYEITAPVFDEITIKLDNKYYTGDTFIIKAYNNSENNCYIQKAKLNGEPLDNFWFTHEEFAKGGKLELWLGDKPNKSWGLNEYPPVN